MIGEKATQFCLASEAAVAAAAVADGYNGRSPKYQVVIPREIREARGIKPGSRMSVFEVNGVIQLVPVSAAAEYRGLLQGLSNTDVGNDPERF